MVPPLSQTVHITRASCVSPGPASSPVPPPPIRAASAAESEVAPRLSLLPCRPRQWQWRQRRRLPPPARPPTPPASSTTAPAARAAAPPPLLSPPCAPLPPPRPHARAPEPWHAASPPAHVHACTWHHRPHHHGHGGRQTHQLCLHALHRVRPRSLRLSQLRPQHARGAVGRRPLCLQPPHLPLHRLRSLLFGRGRPARPLAAAPQRIKLPMRHCQRPTQLLHRAPQHRRLRLGALGTHLRLGSPLLAGLRGSARGLLDRILRRHLYSTYTDSHVRMPARSYAGRRGREYMRWQFLRACVCVRACQSFRSRWRASWMCAICS
jgi:hypothetical protein